MTDSEHHPDELLPWYVNASLSAFEQQQVESHLQQCGRCRGEVELLRAMRDSTKQTAEPAPGEFAWQRLRRDIRQSKTDTSIAANKRQWWMPSLAVAAVLTIAIQGVLLFNYSQQEGYSLAGHDLQGAIVQVKFNPDTTEKDIRAALQEVSGEIVTGPSAVGVYRIRLTDSENDPVLLQRIEQLKANKDVIDYIQQD